MPSERAQSSGVRRESGQVGKGCTEESGCWGGTDEASGGHGEHVLVQLWSHLVCEGGGVMVVGGVLAAASSGAPPGPLCSLPASA